MLPDGALSSEPVPAPYISPHDRSLKDFTRDYELGGVALQDPSKGMRYQVWAAEIREDGIYLGPSWDRKFMPRVIEGEHISLVSLSFDQNMNPVILYRQLEEIKLYWYDPTVQSMVTTVYPEYSTGGVTLDDSRPSEIIDSDILFFAIKEDFLVYRIQRERYQNEYVLSRVPEEFTLNPLPYCTEDYCHEDYTGWYFISFAAGIEINVGMATNNRIMIEMTI